MATSKVGFGDFCSATAEVQYQATTTITFPSFANGAVYLLAIKNDYGAGTVAIINVNVYGDNKITELVSSTHFVLANGETNDTVTVTSPTAWGAARIRRIA